ncbi:hypothetical protein [Streptomyces sp. PVA_94-07]|uniref:hypothetical protein n=1 Tax=Streptomyces sp. PVA_94-07 TaxID=1225337 RepID=UPI000A760432|nr:hypothetical protein [Streptomyces sp. PVA_94-07]
MTELCRGGRSTRRRRPRRPGRACRAVDHALVGAGRQARYDAYVLDALRGVDLDRVPA